MLATRTDVIKFKNISKSAEIDIYIDEAELLDLKPLLGELLYNDLVTNTQDAKYQELMNGKTYTHDSKNYTTKGLMPVLCNFSFARYVLFSGDKDTPFGLVQKNSQYSTHSSTTSKRSQSKQSQQTAYEYWKSVKDFLDRNTTTYPLWDVCVKRRTFRVNKITIK